MGLQNRKFVLQDLYILIPLLHIEDEYIVYILKYGFLNLCFKKVIGEPLVILVEFFGSKFCLVFSCKKGFTFLELFMDPAL